MGKDTGWQSGCVKLSAGEEHQSQGNQNIKDVRNNTIHKRPSTHQCVADRPAHLHVIPLFPNTHLVVSCVGLLPHRWSRHVRGHDCGPAGPKTTILFSCVARQATGTQPNELSAKCTQLCKESNDKREKEKRRQEEKNLSCQLESLTVSESHTLLVISPQGLLLWPRVLIG